MATVHVESPELGTFDYPDATYSQEQSGAVKVFSDDGQRTIASYPAGSCTVAYLPEPKRAQKAEVPAPKVARVESPAASAPGKA